MPRRRRRTLAVAAALPLLAGCAAAGDEVTTEGATTAVAPTDRATASADVPIETDAPAVPVDVAGTATSTSAGPVVGATTAAGDAPTHVPTELTLPPTTTPPTTAPPPAAPPPTTAVATAPPTTAFDPAALPPVPAIAPGSGPGSPQVVTYPLPGGSVYGLTWDDVQQALLLAQRLTDALAAADWATARQLSPDVAGLTDARLVEGYHGLDRSSLMLLDAVPEPGGAIRLLLVLVGNELDGQQTSLYCIEWSANAALGTVEQHTEIGGRFATLPGTVTPEGVRNDPSLDTLYRSSCTWS